MNTQELLEQLEAHPELKTRIIQLLAVVNNKEGDVDLADEAERRVTEELRGLGQQSLESWANRQAAKATRNVKQQKPSLRQHTKKN